MDGWNRVKASDIQYKTTNGKFEMRRPSPAFTGAIISLLFATAIIAPLVVLLINYPEPWFIAFGCLAMFVIAPVLSFPWLPCRNYLIIDNSSEQCELLKKNVVGRVISLKKFSTSDIEGLKIHVAPGESTMYFLYLCFKEKHEIQIIWSTNVTVVREVEKILRSGFPHLKNNATTFDGLGMSFPIKPGFHLSPAAPTIEPPRGEKKVKHAFTCAVDNAVVEGAVYVCPGCHAMLCNTCMAEYIAKSLNCPACGHPVLALNKPGDALLLDRRED